ncbi:DUF4175 family protein [Prolixibacter denitrificans]|uniref:ATPase n=1 Tax=Prolixibacter denitrificans TaxID=1541063 RepID=A0A2P8CHB3_9BACT|nr:DUF4175 family protein [Prolixibacter denitrificans]PSK84374.1 hypothetical protein CLV93_102160 [Prolixibacter denitrificans]GET20549.1 ATPase [Prolixibacter denitrificans]
MKEWKEIDILYNALRRLYYRNKILLGVIRLVLVVVGLSFLLIGLQQLYYFGSDARTVLFYFFIFVVISLFVFFVGLPFFKLFDWLPGVTPTEISNVLKTRFFGLEDRFQNMMELKSVYEQNNGNDLVIASIKQKLEVVQKYPLKEAFRFRLPQMEKWSLTMAAALFLSFSLFRPGFLIKGYHQYVHYNQEFSPAADFSFVLLNDSLSVKKGHSYKIRVRLQGSNFPAHLNVVMNGNQFAMQPVGDGSYNYTIGNVYHDLQFQLNGGPYYSGVYGIKCLAVPVIRSFTVNVIPPKYTSMASRTLENQGDAEIPAGSKVKWTLNAVDADSVFVCSGSHAEQMVRQDDGSFRLDSTILGNTEYFFRVKNVNFTDDGLVYNLKVLKDEYPSIAVKQVQDSVNLTAYYFHGRISDDYGINNVKFHVVGNELDSTSNVSVHPNQNPQDFFYGYSFKGLKPGVYQYWFTVADNDKLHHFKKKQSEVFTFRFPGFHEVEAENKKGYQRLEDKLNEGKEAARKIQQDFGKMRNKMLSGQLTDWEKKQISEGIRQQNSQLHQLMDNVSKENRELNNLSKNFSQLSPALLEKQKQVEQLMDQLYSDDLKKLFDELNTLMNQFDQKKFNELTKDINYRLDDLSKQLDRNIALLKKMQVEKSIHDIENNLQELAKQQKTLSDLMKKGGRSKEDSLLAKQDEDIKAAFSAIDSVMKQNGELEKPYSINKSGSLRKEINDDMQSLSEKKESRNKRSDTSDRISHSLKKVAENLNKSMLSSQMEIDWEQVRRIQYLADNILTYSFQQENLMEEMKGVSALDPALTGYLDKQKNLVQFEEQLRDTLYLLSKQAPQINMQIGKESLNWKYYTDKALSGLEESQYQKGRINQQFSMTSANNLALYLSEALQQIMDMMKNAQPGDGTCNRPGGKSSSIPSLAELQKKLKQQMQGMLDDLKSGQNPGNEQIGEMLMQQEMIEQAIREQVLKGNLGPDVEKQLKEAQRLLNQNRNDLVSKNVTQQTVKRQNLIFEHLLDAKNAKMQRNSDNERESETAKNQLVSHPQEFFEKEAKKEDELDIISRSSWRMNYFYREKFNSYLKNINGR